MKFVEIYQLQNNGSQKTIVVCELSGNEVVCKGDMDFVSDLNDNGIPDYSKDEGNMLFPKDGIKFLEQLKFVFKSVYLNASEVK